MSVLCGFSWTDVLSQQVKWQQLCLIGKKVEGAAGIGAKAVLRLAIMIKQVSFYCECMLVWLLGSVRLVNLC